MNYYFNGEFRKCQQTGAYRMRSRQDPFKLIMDYYHFLKTMTSNIELKTTIYKNTSSQPILVMYIRAQIKVPHNGKHYPVIKQAIFPPNFPAVPPIFSVVNWDKNKYDVHNFYRENILPDESFEVRLTSSSTFKEHLDMRLCYSDMTNLLSEFFPFIFRQVRPLPSIPFYFRQEYNDPNGTFPVPKIMNHNNNQHQDQVILFSIIFLKLQIKEIIIFSHLVTTKAILKIMEDHMVKCQNQ